MLTNAGYTVCDIARSVVEAEEIIKRQRPDFVLLDIFLKGKLTGIDLAIQLQKNNIPFVYLSANSNEEVLSAAKATHPYGFLVKPFREKDLLVTLEIANYRHEQSQDAKWRIEMKTQKELQDIKKMDGTWVQKMIRTAITLQQYVPFDILAIKFRQRRTITLTGLLFFALALKIPTIGIAELSVISRIKRN